MNRLGFNDRDIAVMQEGEVDSRSQVCWRAPLAQPKLIEPRIVNPEVMPQLVDHRLAYLLADLFIIPADGLDGLLVDADLVWEHEVVVLAAVRKRNAVIQPQQRTTGRKARYFAVPRGGPPFNDDLDILDALQQFARERGDGLAYQAAESLAFQVLPRGPRSGPERPEAPPADGVKLLFALEIRERAERLPGAFNRIVMPGVSDPFHDFFPDAGAFQ